MDVALALLADHANLSADGKLNILGVFDTLWADRFPAVHPQMQLVLRLEAHPAELGSKKKLEIKLMAEDGRTVLTMAAELGFDRTGPERPLGEALRSDQIIGFGNVPLGAPGNYQFAILVNEETKCTLPLKVRQRPPAAGA